MNHATIASTRSAWFKPFKSGVSVVGPRLTPLTSHPTMVVLHADAASLARDFGTEPRSRLFALRAFGAVADPRGAGGSNACVSLIQSSPQRDEKCADRRCCSAIRRGHIRSRSPSLACRRLRPVGLRRAPARFTSNRPERPDAHPPAGHRGAPPAARSPRAPVRALHWPKAPEHRRASPEDHPETADTTAPGANGPG